MLDQLAAPGIGIVASSSLASRPSPAGGLRPALTPAPGDTGHRQPPGAGRGCKNRDPGGMFVGGVVWGLGWAVGCSFSLGRFFLILLGKRIVIEHRFE